MRSSKDAPPAEPTRRYLVVSDLHLCDVEDHPDGWKDYKHSRFLFDDELALTVQQFVADGAAGDQFTLILNGDIIDFDLVCSAPKAAEWPISKSERKFGLEPTEVKSAWKLERVLADHPRFVDMLARFIGGGHTVVYVIGNHDPEFHFPAVRKTLVDAIAERAAAQRVEFAPERMRFEPWFYCVPGEIYAEHGHQYDYYSSFRYQLNPVVASDDPPIIALPMGNLANRRLMSWMGFFNPHATDYILNVFRYVHHWLKHYAFSRRNLVLPFVWGSVSVLLRLMRTKRKLLASPPDREALLAEVAARMDLSRGTVKKLDQLKRLPITNRVYRMVREFWIDRVLLGLVMTVGTVALAVMSVPLWTKLMIPLSSFPLLFLIYEWFAHGETVHTVEQEIHRYAVDIAQLVNVKVITFGHTHAPRLVPLLPGVSYANTGTWAPVPKSNQPGSLRPGLRTILRVTVGPDDEFDVRLETKLSSQAAAAVLRARRISR